VCNGRDQSTVHEDVDANGSQKQLTEVVHEVSSDGSFSNTYCVTQDSTLLEEGRFPA
jgi:hypothetical protein